MKLFFKNKQLNLESPAVMGILNVTPDSFFDGGKYNTAKAILRHAGKMIAEGADIIDIGACSTRPGAKEVSEKEEIKRLLPAIEHIRKKFPDIIISADTFRSRTAELAVTGGADMINDISGGNRDTHMFRVIGKLKVPYVLMHIQGTPQTMQRSPHYRNIITDVTRYFEERIKALEKAGVRQIILDPGFGFGKTTEHNYKLLKHLSVFKNFGYPLLAGVSRKSMINNVLGTTPETALNGSTAVNMIALMNGATLLRVHDVKAACEAVKIFTFTRAIQ